MAKEYIERSKVKEELLSWARCIKHPEHLLTEDAMCVLDNINAADVVEVVHGRWEARGFYGHNCSVCGALNDIDTNYCPTCGARMDGE